MSLSRIVKNPTSVVFSDVVQIKEQIINKPSPMTISDDSDLSQQLVTDAQIEAQKILDLAQAKIHELNQEFEKSCIELEKKIKQEAFNQGYLEGRNEVTKTVLDRFQTMFDAIETSVNEKNILESKQVDELQNRTHLLAIEVASKIMHQKIELDCTLLKPIIMDELETRKRQNIKTVEISKHANSLFNELEKDLQLLGIDLHAIESDISHLVIEGEMGRYDLSIDTQLKNIRRLFNTI